MPQPSRPARRDEGASPARPAYAERSLRSGCGAAGRVVELGLASGSSSAVECDLAKVEVAGSDPVSRSSIYRRNYQSPGNGAGLFSGAVPKW